MNPNIQAFLDETRQFSEAHAKPKVRRVKIEKVNQAWQVRFLPVGLGDNDLWFVQQAQHWHSQKFHIYCPRCTTPDFGGNPDAECPVCDLADSLNNESNEEVSSFGFKLRANITYITYCLVYQIDPGRGDVTEMPLNEVLKPWEFTHYKSSFDELVDFFRRGVSPKRPFSVLDLEQGNDFWATKTTKGIRLDRLDERTPVLAKDEKYEQYLDQIFNAIAQPKITIPTLKELDAFALKAEATAVHEDEGRPIRGRRGVDEDDQGAEDDSVRPNRRLGRNSRRMASPTAPGEQQDGEPQAEEDQVPGAEVPPRRAPAPAASAARTAAPAARTAASTRAPAPAARTAAPAATAATRTASPAARTAAPAARTATPAARTVAPAARTAAPARAAAAAPPAPADGSVNEEDDPGVAEEASDQAAPAEESLAENELPPEEAPPEDAAQDGAAQDGAAEAAPTENDEAPPQPALRPGRAAAPASANLKNRLLSRARPA